MTWWTSFFDETFARIGLDPTSEQALRKRDATIDLLLDKLGIRAGDTVLDQCCGIGRLSIPLAKRGVRVIGVDQAARYIEIAHERSRDLPCEFHVADAAEFVAPRACDAAINWFTSFGYSHDDRWNARMLERAHESLRIGGRIALDYVNVPRVLAEFRNSMVDRIATADGELLLIQEPSIEFRSGMMHGTWTLIRPSGSREVRHVENRAYMPHELVGLFECAGFAEIELFDADGSPYKRDSRRCVVVGTKR